MPDAQDVASVRSSEVAALDMAAELEADDPVFLPSAFWRDLNDKNRRMLEEEGLGNFKRTVSQNYFNWLVADRKSHLFRHAFRQWCRRPNLLPLLTRLEETRRLRTNTADGRVELSARERHTYRLYVCFVWTIMRRLDRHRLRLRVAEPEIGNPFPLRCGRKLLTQDLATSIMECNVLADLTEGVSAPRIGELGAGYGRVAHAYASSLPGRYFIFDIPPALAVAQWYLEQALGRERVFRFRHFDRIEDVQDEIDRASVALFTANQIRKFPDNYFDVTVSISTLPEMRQDQVDLYLAEFQRLSRGHIFLKQFKAWKNPSDGTDLTIDSYRLHPDWQLVVDRSDPVIPCFFNRVWCKRPPNRLPPHASRDTHAFFA
jgi:putative sugar O-methyltransferase